MRVSAKRYAMMKSIKEIVRDRNAVFVDVRSPQEFNDDHIPSALNIPLDQLMGRIDELAGIVGPIVLYCRSGNRSGMALHILQAEGMKNLYNGGGIDDVRFLLN
jgi:phage shock protein E